VTRGASRAAAAGHSRKSGSPSGAQRWPALARRVADELWAVRVLAGVGFIPLGNPRELIATAADQRRWGQLGAIPSSAARRHHGRTAIVDERGAVTFEQLDERVNRLANAWRSAGLRAGDGVALLARNHRGMLEASFAAVKLGARLILLNTEFAGPQIRDVVIREDARLLIHDDEWTEAVRDLPLPLGRVQAWTDGSDSPAEPAPHTLDGLIATGAPGPPPRPATEAKLIVLTSGTTGAPKGAPRASPKTLVPIGGYFDKIPFRAREATVVAIPLFHALGFANAIAALGIGSTVILRRRFDPAAIVTALVEHGATSLIVVPTVLRRVLDRVAATTPSPDLRRLRIVFVAGSQLGGELALRTLATLGPVLYNLYGSTEVSAVTIATPDELGAAPGSVGTPPRGVTLRLYDDHGRPLDETGVTGRIFAGTGTEFEGYTGGGTKTVIDGLMATGDVGHLDAAGRLTIDGRDDDMIVSGGENLFPGEVEDSLRRHPEIIDAAVIGVPDEEFGARLRAFVVRREGSDLDEDGVRAHARQTLARFKVPRDVVFLDELPRNPTGKVLKRELTA